MLRLLNEMSKSRIHTVNHVIITIESLPCAQSPLPLTDHLVRLEIVNVANSIVSVVSFLTVLTVAGRVPDFMGSPQARLCRASARLNRGRIFPGDHGESVCSRDDFNRQSSLTTNQAAVGCEFKKGSRSRRKRRTDSPSFLQGAMDAFRFRFVLGRSF
jgi:hypothetical protein